MFCEFIFGHFGSGIWLLFCTSMKNVTIFQLPYFIREKKANSYSFLYANDIWIVSV